MYSETITRKMERFFFRLKHVSIVEFSKVCARFSNIVVNINIVYGLYLWKTFQYSAAKRLILFIWFWFAEKWKKEKRFDEMMPLVLTDPHINTWNAHRAPNTSAEAHEHTSKTEWFNRCDTKTQTTNWWGSLKTKGERGGLILWFERLMRKVYKMPSSIGGVKIEKSVASFFGCSIQLSLFIINFNKKKMKGKQNHLCSSFSNSLSTDVYLVYAKIDCKSPILNIRNCLFLRNWTFLVLNDKLTITNRIWLNRNDRVGTYHMTFSQKKTNVKCKQKQKIWWWFLWMIWNKSYFLDASASPMPTRPPITNAAPPATATPAIVSFSIFFRMCSCENQSNNVMKCWQIIPTRESKSNYL